MLASKPISLSSATSHSAPLRQSAEKAGSVEIDLMPSRPKSRSRLWSRFCRDDRGQGKFWTCFGLSIFGQTLAHDPENRNRFSEKDHAQSQKTLQRLLRVQEDARRCNGRDQKRKAVIVGPRIGDMSKGKKEPPWWRGNHGGLYSKRCGSPERGDRLPQFARYRRGTGLTPDFGEKCR